MTIVRHCPSLHDCLTAIMTESKKNGTTANLADVLTNNSDQFRRIPIDQAQRTLITAFEQFDEVTEQECLLIGDALLSLRSALTASEYHQMLKKIRLTPVVAWEYES